MLEIFGRSTYDDWREEAISGQLAESDWNICGKCMEKLRSYLQPPSSSSSSASSDISSSKEGCFIATACYGSPYHDYVMFLKDFRDNYLSKSSFGLLLVKTYYKYSPFIANTIREKPMLRKMVKHLLIGPLVQLVVCFISPYKVVQ